MLGIISDNGFKAVSKRDKVPAFMDLYSDYVRKSGSEGGDKQEINKINSDMINSKKKKG